jgi:cellulose biosynthesis protein BcsQ
LAVGLALRDNKVLLIDMDPQANSARALGFDLLELRIMSEASSSSEFHFFMNHSHSVKYKARGWVGGPDQ